MSATGSRTCSRTHRSEDASVIVRTAAEGASEDELIRDVNRLTARWEEIEKKIKGGQAPRSCTPSPTHAAVVRDLFTEDFGATGHTPATTPATSLTATSSTSHRTSRRDWSTRTADGDVFSSYRVDEQVAKALDRKVWLPSGGSLIIDRTEAMTVVDVNTGKFTGTSGNLEETVTQEQPRGRGGDRPPAPAA